MKFTISVLLYILFIIVKRNSGLICNTNVDCGLCHPDIPVEIICCGLNNDQIITKMLYVFLYEKYSKTTYYHLTSYPRCCPDISCRSCNENGQIFEVCDYECPFGKNEKRNRKINFLL